MIQLFCQAEERRFIARRALASALVCYAISFVAALLILPLAVHCAYSPVSAAISAVAYVLLVVGIAGVTAELQFSRFRRQYPLPKRALVLALLRVIPWLIPVMVLCMRGSMVGILGVGAFAIVSAKLLRRLWKLLSGDATEVCVVRSREFSLDFSELPNAGVNLPGLTALICVAYFGVAAGLNGNTIISVSCTGVSCFFLGWLEDRYAQSNKQFRSSVVPTLLAIVVTFIGLLPPFGHLGLASYEADHSKQENSAKLDQLQSGVILLTERKAPIPLILRHPEDTLRTRTKQTLSSVASILFSGEYWFFHWPLRRPPASALMERGDPTSMNVTSEDFRTMVMQARQSIGRSIDVHCCHWIDVVVNGDDQEPETVVMELILMNSSAPQHNSQTLGAETLASPLRISASPPSKTKNASFRFAMPSHPAIRSFDELVVWFHLEAPRSRRSATVAIERFDLIP